MKRFLIASSLLIAGTLLGAALCLVGGKLVAWRTTLSRLSPDETLRASLVEPEFRFDRNFRVKLESLYDGKSSILLHSPDEGDPYGSERLIWSKDGKWVLLVGRHFFVKADLFLDNGDQLYFLYHVPSKKGWINSDASTEWPTLDASAINGIEFTEPIVLKPR